jgi:hypothetical protein
VISLCQLLSCAWFALPNCGKNSQNGRGCVLNQEAMAKRIVRWYWDSVQGKEGGRRVYRYCGATGLEFFNRRYNTQSCQKKSSWLTSVTGAEKVPISKESKGLFKKLPHTRLQEWNLHDVAGAEISALHVKPLIFLWLKPEEGKKLVFFCNTLK